MVLMVLELMEGGELFDRLVAVKHFTEQQARRIMKQVSSCLSAIVNRYKRIIRLAARFFTCTH